MWRSRKLLVFMWSMLLPLHHLCCAELSIGLIRAWREALGAAVAWSAYPHMEGYGLRWGCLLKSTPHIWLKSWPRFHCHMYLNPSFCRVHPPVLFCVGSFLSGALGAPLPGRRFQSWLLLHHHPPVLEPGVGKRRPRGHMWPHELVNPACRAFTIISPKAKWRGSSVGF